MRVAHLLPESPLRAVGIFRSVEQLASHQVVQGATVALVLPQRSIREIGSTARSVLTVRPYRFPWDVTRVVREFAPSVLHIHGCWHPANALAAHVCRSDDLPYTFSPHGMLLPVARSLKAYKKRPYWHIVEKGMVAGAAACLVSSEGEAVTIRELYHGAVEVLPSGLTEIPSPSALNSAAQLDCRDNAVLFLGRLHPIKNIESILLAASCLPQGWRVLVAGTGTRRYSDHLRRLALRECRVPVDFLGEVRGSSKWELLRRVRALILASHSENFGHVVLEALTVGTPVIASQATPWSLLQVEDAGAWVPGTPEGLESALKSLASQPDLWMMRGIRGRAIAERFRWPEIARRTLDAYARTIRSAHR